MEKKKSFQILPIFVSFFFSDSKYKENNFFYKTFFSFYLVLFLKKGKNKK